MRIIAIALVSTILASCGDKPQERTKPAPEPARHVALTQEQVERLKDICVRLNQLEHKLTELEAREAPGTGAQRAWLDQVKRFAGDSCCQS